MKVDSYELRGSSVGEGQTLLIPTGKGLAGLPQPVLDLLPKGITAQNARPTMTMDLQAGEQRISLNADEALAAVERDGYFIARHRMKVTMEIRID